MLFDAGEPRALRDRRVDLPGDAGGRRRPAHARTRRSRRCRSPMEEGVPVLPRGAGTSQCGQTVGEALVIDDSKLPQPRARGRCRGAHARSSSPGVVLDTLNAQLRPHGLWYPGRRLHVGAGDDRRHDAATTRAARARSPTATWSIACARSTRGCPTGVRGRFGADAPMDDPRIRELAAKAAALCGSASATRSPRAIPKVGAQRRGLQPRSPRARRLQPRAAAGRQRGHARVVRAHPPQARRSCRSTRRSASRTSRASTTRWMPRSTS